jgi:predicted transcriptional regulator
MIGRFAVYDFIRKNPGCRIRQIEKFFGAGISYHLIRLRREGKVKSRMAERPDGRYRIYFAK